MQNRIRELRKKRGLTMKKLGEIVGVAESTISQYENAKRQPDNQTLLMLGEFFDVSVDYILGAEANEKPIAQGDELSEIEFIFSQLTPSRQTKLLELARLYLDDQRRTKETQ